MKHKLDTRRVTALERRERELEYLKSLRNSKDHLIYKKRYEDQEEFNKVLERKIRIAQQEIKVLVERTTK